MIIYVAYARGKTDPRRLDILNELKPFGKVRRRNIEADGVKIFRIEKRTYTIKGLEIEVLEDLQDGEKRSCENPLYGDKV